MIVCNVQELGDRDTVPVLFLPPRCVIICFTSPGVVQDQGRTGASTVSSVPSCSFARLVKFL